MLRSKGVPRTFGSDCMLNCCLTAEYILEWLTKGTTVLIMKDTKKGNDVADYRPITCLSMLWKFLYEEIYDHLEANHLLPVEQKGCRTRTQGTTAHRQNDY